MGDLTKAVETEPEHIDHESHFSWHHDWVTEIFVVVAVCITTIIVVWFKMRCKTKNSKET